MLYEVITQVLKDLSLGGHQVEIFFFDATDEILARRYSETRRRHPLALKESVQEGILRERMLLAQLRKISTTIIDTSPLTPHQLRDKVVNAARGDIGNSPLAVFV